MKKKYKLKYSPEFSNDLEKIISSKRKWGFYETTIEEFKGDIRSRFETLQTMPDSGSNVSSRIDKNTDLKYFVIHDCVLVYRILKDDDIVHVLSLWFTRSNWLHMIFD